MGACAAFLAGGTVGQAQRRGEPAGPDAFLRFQVESTDELVEVLRTNPTLRKRYAKHFGVSEAEVVDFVKRALVPYRLPEARAVTTYGVTKTGRIYAVRTRLKKGTRVWANRSGVPVLKWLCANPLTNRLPGTRITTAPKLSAPPKVAQVDTSRAVPPVLEEGVPVVPELIPGESITPPVRAGSEIGGVGTGTVIPSIGGGGGGLGLLPAAFVPLLFNNGGRSGTPTVLAPPPAVIPEPGTMALLAGGGVPLVIAAVRRKRRQQRNSTPES